MPLSLLTVSDKDINKMEVEALVNVTSTDHQGVNQPVFRQRDEAIIKNACTRLAFLQDMESGKVDLDVGNLSHRFTAHMNAHMILHATLTAKHIISTTAPVYIDGKHGEELLLRSCYIDALNLAQSSGCKSVAFPLIASKVYEYPQEEALAIATNAISDWLSTNDMDVTLLVLDKKAFSPSKALLHDVDSFIDSHYEFRANHKYRGFLGKIKATNDRTIAEQAGKHELSRSGRYIRLIDQYPHIEFSDSDPFGVDEYAEKLRRLHEELGEKLDDSFSVALIELINSKGKKAVEVYKRANIDRKLFSKIRNEFYTPGKRTTIALAVALELSLDETKDLLKRTGYTLSRSLLFDVIIEYFISQGNYNIFEINNVLFSYNQPILGG